MSIILGGNQADTINGTSGSDIIISGNGNDVINSGAGNDVVTAGNGNDVVNGGAGDDIVDGGNGNDILDGGSGNDIVYGGNGNDIFNYDIIDNLGFVDLYVGGNGSDTLVMRLDLARYNSSMFNLETLTQMINNFNNHASPIFTFAGINIDLAILGIENIQLQTYGQAITLLAQNDNYTLNEDGSISGTLLTNDTAPAGVSVSLVGNAPEGLTLNANGTFSYNPALNFNGQVSFNYKLTYNGVESNVAAVNFTVNPVNDAPTGSLVINGVLEQGQTLTASNTLADVDGLGAITYQWQADGVSITGATGETLLLTQALIGKSISVVASYVDGHGTAEGVTSDATAAVTATPSVTYNPSTIQDGAVVTLNGVNDVLDTRGLPAVSYVTSTGVLSEVANSANDMVVTGAEHYILKGGDNIRIDSDGHYDVYATGNAVITLVEGHSTTLSFTRDLASPILQMEFNNQGPNLDNVATLDFNNKAFSFNATAIEYGLIASLISPGVISALAPYNYITTDLSGVSGVTAKVTGLLTLPSNYFSQYDQSNPFIVNVNIGADLLNANQVANPDTADFSAINQGLKLSSGPVISLSPDGGESYITPVTQQGAFAIGYNLINFEKVILTDHDDVIVNQLGNAVKNFINDTVNYVDMGNGFDTIDFSTAITTSPNAVSIRYDGNLNELKITNAAAESKTMTVLNVEKIIGTNSNDTFISGQQDEIFKGNNGADNFVFLQNNGHDVIEDFTAGDKINLHDFGTSFAELAMSQEGANVQIQLGTDNTLTLNNMTLENLHASDFIF
ncbi:Ig-like domain-containing protein [Legionella shakespearei]|uniref:Structural toxin protein RtxA n=1 Tax=Legionella shakespearei DSM 23087 TaxID=1122169 RepID=A0A0W0YK51_9GAMM|nr:Ig-like domain-containing protein [Legionella shakespearei]KTD57234.1 structural toxin protein RtxA [Legionella shakespearei DSM 23087]